MTITEVKIYLVDEEPVRAYATVTFDDSFVVRDVKVVRGSQGLFVSMPSKRVKDGRYLDVAHPKNPIARKYIEQTIVEAYQKELNESQAEVQSNMPPLFLNGSQSADSE